MNCQRPLAYAEGLVIFEAAMRLTERPHSLCFADHHHIAADVAAREGEQLAVT